MGATKTYRFQATTPVVSAADTGAAHYHVDNSGVLKFVRPGGDVYFGGQVWTQQLSGTVGGTLGGAGPYFVMQGPSGQRLAIPTNILT